MPGTFQVAACPYIRRLESGTLPGVLQARVSRGYISACQCSDVAILFPGFSLQEQLFIKNIRAAERTSICLCGVKIMHALDHPREVNKREKFTQAAQ